MTFCNKLISYDEELLVPRPTLKLEGHLLSDVRYELLFIYSQLTSISGGRLLRPQHEDASCPGDKIPTQYV
jgi:hypothetical protein